MGWPKTIVFSMYRGAPNASAKPVNTIIFLIHLGPVDRRLYSWLKTTMQHMGGMRNILSSFDPRSNPVEVPAIAIRPAFEFLCEVAFKIK